MLLLLLTVCLNRKVFLYFVGVYHIPSRKQSAAKLTKYFLKRDVSVGVHAKDRTLRSKYPNVDYAQFYDTIFLIDSSSSVNRLNFERGMHALRQLIDRGLPDSYYAAISFASEARLEFSFVDKETAKLFLRKVKYRRGRTNTQAALRMALYDLIRNSTSNVRYGSVRRIFLISDGLSNVQQHLTLFQGFRLKASGVQIFVMAVGRYRHGFEEILGLASSTHAHLYRVGHMSGFLRMMKFIPTWPVNPNELKTWKTSVQNRRFLFKTRNKIMK